MLDIKSVSLKDKTKKMFKFKRHSKKTNCVQYSFIRFKCLPSFSMLFLHAIVHFNFRAYVVVL